MLFLGSARLIDAVQATELFETKDYAPDTMPGYDQNLAKEAR